MARIKGVDIPNDKHIVISLTYIYGIGRNLAKTICEKAGIEPTKKAGELSVEELTQIIKDTIVEVDAKDIKDMGKVMGVLKANSLHDMPEHVL